MVFEVGHRRSLVQHYRKDVHCKNKKIGRKGISLFQASASIEKSLEATINIGREERRSDAHCNPLNEEIWETSEF